MMKPRSPFRRVAVVAIALGALLGTPRRADAQVDPIDCLIVLGSACFVAAEACDALPLVPRSFCDALFEECVLIAVDVCFPEIPI